MSLTSKQAAGLCPTDVLITEQLFLRSGRTPDYGAEIDAYSEVIGLLLDEPRIAVRKILDAAMQFCGAGSAGISLLQPNAEGEVAFHWDIIAGTLQPCTGGLVPRDFSVSGLCLDAGTTILVSQPARVFTYLDAVGLEIAECLVVPLVRGAGPPLGTVWAVHHEPSARFCAEDAQRLERLAAQLVLALRLRTRDDPAGEAVQAELAQRSEGERRSVARELAAEHTRLEAAQAFNSELWQALAFKDATIHEVHHRVKNTIQLAASLMALQARRSGLAEVRDVLTEAQGRMMILAKVHELLYRSAESAQLIDMAQMLEALATTVERSFVRVSPRVRLSVHSDHVTLGPDQAIPLALLINEALTNAYKHAFPGDAVGEVKVSLQWSANRALLVEISDNGIGISMSVNQDGLGHTLLRSFAAQLQGSFSMVSSAAAAGTRIAVEIPQAALNGKSAGKE